MPVPVITHTVVPSVTGDGDDMFCFRCLVVAAAERPLPQRLALLAIDRPQLEVAARHRGRDVEEDVIVPDDRRCAAAARHRQLPRDVLLGRPLDGQALLAAHAVGERAAPRRPVLGAERVTTNARQPIDRNARNRFDTTVSSKRVNRRSEWWRRKLSF